MIVLQLSRWLPGWLQEKLFFRFFYPVKEEWFGLFNAAPLKFVPGIKMKLLHTDIMHARIAIFGVYGKLLSKHLSNIGRKGGMMIRYRSECRLLFINMGCCKPDKQGCCF